MTYLFGALGILAIIAFMLWAPKVVRWIKASQNLNNLTESNRKRNLFEKKLASQKKAQHEKVNRIRTALDARRLRDNIINSSTEDS